MMNTFAVLLICGSLALCQAESVTPTPASAASLDGVTTQTPSVLENVIVSVTDPAMNEVLAFGENVMFVVSERLNSLSEETRPVGEKLIAETRDGLHSCENALRQGGTIWEYKVCCSSYLRYSMSSIAGLAAQAVGRSGAARPTLFFM